MGANNKRASNKQFTSWKKPDFVEWIDIDGVTTGEDQIFRKKGEYLVDEWKMRWKLMFLE